MQLTFLKYKEKKNYQVIKCLAGKEVHCRDPNIHAFIFGFSALFQNLC